MDEHIKAAMRELEMAQSLLISGIGIGGETSCMTSANVRISEAMGELTLALADAAQKG